MLPSQYQAASVSQPVPLYEKKFLIKVSVCVSIGFSVELLNVQYSLPSLAKISDIFISSSCALVRVLILASLTLTVAAGFSELVSGLCELQLVPLIVWKFSTLSTVISIVAIPLTGLYYSSMISESLDI